MLTYFASYIERMKAERPLDDFTDEPLPLEHLDWETVWSFDGMLYEDQKSMLDSLPSPVRHALGNEWCWVAGGHVRRWIAGESLTESDIDLFFANPENKEATEKLLSDPKYGFKETYRCPENKLTTFALERGDAPPIEVQCVAAGYYTDPVDCIETFDFTVSQFAFDGRTIFMGRLSLLHLETKVLRLHSLPFPVATMKRMIKYGQNGYWLPEETARDFMCAIASAADSTGINGEVVLSGGFFEDGRPANIDEDAFRWYVD